MIDLTDDAVVLHIASFLAAVDILNAALTCRRFGSAAAGTAADDDRHPSSLMEQGSRQLIDAAPAYERSWVLPYKKNPSCSSTTPTSWIGLYHELLKLRTPPTFNTILGRGIKHINNNKHHVYVSLREQYQEQQLQDAKRLILRKRHRLMSSAGSTDNSNSYVSCVAIGNHIMRAGKHYVKFTMTRVEKISFGIIRPIDENMLVDAKDRAALDDDEGENQLLIGFDGDTNKANAGQEAPKADAGGLLDLDSMLGGPTTTTP